jgi:hypothetical protein
MAGEVLPPSESDGLGGASLVSSSGYNLQLGVFFSNGHRGKTYPDLNNSEIEKGTDMSRKGIDFLVSPIPDLGLQLTRRRSLFIASLRSIAHLRYYCFTRSSLELFRISKHQKPASKTKKTSETKHSAS